MKTDTELFGIAHPIIQGGIHYVGFPLASAISNAGGLGIITALTLKTPEDLAVEIKKCRDLTDKPFGVNLTFLPSCIRRLSGYIRAIIEGGVQIVKRQVAIRSHLCISQSRHQGYLGVLRSGT